MSIPYKKFGLAILIGLVSCRAVLAVGPSNNLKSLEANAGLCKAKGDYKQAAHLFGDAAALAEKSQLPAKYREIALCRETEAEVLAGEILIAEPHLVELLKLVKANKCCPVESDLAIWMVDLAKTYQNYPDQKKRLGCLERACYICELTYGRDRKGFWDAMSLLADYFIENGQIEKGVKVTAVVVTEEEKRFGKNPNALGDTLYQLAVKYKTEHKYEQARLLALLVIKMAQGKTNTLMSGLPAFYSFLGINCMTQSKNAEGQEYFKEATSAWSKIATTDHKNLAGARLALRLYFAPLLETIWSDRQDNKLLIAEMEYKELLKVEQAVFTDPLEFYGIYTRLAAILELEGKLSEAEKYLANCIDLGNRPNSFVRNFVAEFYMRTGFCQCIQHRQKEANISYAKAIKAEIDQNSFHAAGVWKSWGCCLRDSGQLPLALEKLRICLKIARDLPPEKRSDLLAEALQAASDVQGKLGNRKEAEALHEQSLAEVRLQQNLDSRLTRNKYGGYD